MSGDLRIEGLRARTGSFEVGPLDLHLPASGYGVVVGPSGAGKSTLLQALAGMLPAAGSARLGSVELLALPPEQRRVGFVPQSGLLFPHLSVAENVGFGVPRNQRRERVPEMLARVGAAALAGRDPRTLSGGETMRVALARALAIGPRLLLLDEPLSGLDPGARDDLLGLLDELPIRSGDLPVLHITHDFDEVARIATHLTVVLDGQVAAAGAPDSIFARPLREDVAAFLGRRASHDRARMRPVGNQKLA